MENNNVIITLDDILNNIYKHKDLFLENGFIDRNKTSKILEELLNKNLKVLNNIQIKNLINYLHEIDEDEKVHFLMYVIRKNNGEYNEFDKTLLSPFKNFIKQFSDYFENNDTEKILINKVLEII